jgi:ankyrin repeat protein
VASKNGHLAVVERLLQEPWDPRVDPSALENDALEHAILNDETAIVQRLLQDPRVDPSLHNNFIIRWASKHGHIDLVNQLLQEPLCSRIDPSANNNEAIQSASCNNHLCIVERLLQDPRVDPTADNNYAIRHASANGRLAVDSATAWRNKRLLQEPWGPRIILSNGYNDAIRMATHKGQDEIIRLLKRHQTPKPYYQTLLSSLFS